MPSCYMNIEFGEQEVNKLAPTTSRLQRLCMLTQTLASKFLNQKEALLVAEFAGAGSALFLFTSVTSALENNIPGAIFWGIGLALTATIGITNSIIFIRNK